MHIRFYLVIVPLLLGKIVASYGQTNYPYRNSSLAVEERVSDLLSRMSLAEKVRQMDMYKGDLFKTNEQFDVKKTRAAIGDLGVGAIHDIYPRSEKMINDLQKHIINNNRWGIPALIMAEALHGYVDDGNTAFPMSIGLGATWDPELLEEIGAVIGTEARAHGVHYALGPVLGIGREPRWGRVAETFGEDAYLAGELGLAIIQGMQGDTLASQKTVVADPKHFAVHSAPQAGGNSSPVIVGERTAREDFLSVFKKAFVQEGAMGTMAAYSELDGIPCIINKWLLTDVLRNEWGFKGMVISDLGAIKYAQTTHYVTDSPKESIRQAVEAGVDMQFYDFSNAYWQETLLQLVKENKVSMTTIDRAAGAVLRLKFTLGLFENPYVPKGAIAKAKNNNEHQDLALLAAQKSICLLKNENELLPLSKKLKKIAVIGPNADATRLGGYAVRNKTAVTMLEGIKAAVDTNTQVDYIQGIDLIEKGQVIPTNYLFTPDKKSNGLQGTYFNNRKLEGKAAATRIDAQLEFDWPWFPAPGVNDDNFSIRWEGFLKTDVDFQGWLGLSSDDGIRMYLNDQLVIDNWTKGATNIVTHPIKIEKGKFYKIKIEMWEGGWGARAHLRWNLKKPDLNPAITLAKNADVAIVVVGESNELIEENRDVASLDLMGLQNELISAITATGTPTICVLLNGRPLSINTANAEADAILEAWFPGEKGGHAVADVLFGDYVPAGRLPITFPKSVGQLPIYYNQKPSAIHRYVLESQDPLYPFGYGLSYTTFEYADLKLSDKTIGTDDSVSISVTVTNTGNYDAEEVVQLYLNDVYSSVTTPRKTLKGFDRVFIAKGTSEKITFTLTPEELAIWDRNMNFTVEPGMFEVFVGGNQTAMLKGTFEVVKD